jgi:hypothetical protein
LEGKGPAPDMSYGTIICLINECYSQQGVSLHDDVEKHSIFPLRSKIVAKDVYSLCGKRIMLKTVKVFIYQLMQKRVALKEC